ncbi:glycosyltransferase family 34 protein [Xylona heveae TC161]|uniref:Glycosyltransferase family 34 protein n=1 Tax=Xylona heveae (strain CBS 132557 / TC161) TaxID=1328760 RepID=A0A165A4L8_XYLHT|nr:glycosyltransferase family 34 protein [Xylona heveae TC161]KZF19942.1 glycosyltransferase family 34 protein [Xylona heveae TC161]
MQFALPPRKFSHPSFSESKFSPSSSLRRRRLQSGAILACAAITVLFLLTRIYSFIFTDRPPAGTPKVVVVTAFDAVHTPVYTEKIKENRRDYASRHGYATFFPKVTDYDLSGHPSSWAKVPAMRHAMTKFPYTTYFFYLDQNALIMNPSLALDDHIMSPKRLESLMLRDTPVVLPDSVIKTFSHLKGDRIDLVLAQDNSGIAQGSFVLRRGEWAKYFLDSWFDPLYRNYNFQKNEGHALEHIVQWHATILAKLALVPQRLLNSYNADASGAGAYKPGDFVINFPNCDMDGGKSCEEELEPYFIEWRTQKAQHKYT